VYSKRPLTPAWRTFCGWRTSSSEPSNGVARRRTGYSASRALERPTPGVWPVSVGTNTLRNHRWGIRIAGALCAMALCTRRPATKAVFCLQGPCQRRAARHKQPVWGSWALDAAVIASYSAASQVPRSERVGSTMGIPARSFDPIAGRTLPPTRGQPTECLNHVTTVPSKRL
jgi:hypothetical protein